MLIGGLSEFQLHQAEAEVNWETFDIPKAQPSPTIWDTTISDSVKQGKPPTRFIFLHKGNGLLPGSLALPSFDDQHQQSEKKKEAFSVDLDGQDLPEWMSPISGHMQNMTILQGLSGKMCTTGHHTWCSSLGVFKANERLSSSRNQRGFR